MDMNGWIPVTFRLPLKNAIYSFVVYCPAISEDPRECVKMGTFTTHGRGIGIRPAGPEYYHLANHVTHWKHICVPIHVRLNF